MPPNSFSATTFVAWYNGHPDYADFKPDLSCDGAVVVGVGNVAMDVARILAKSVDELNNTDIADYALEQLAASQVKDIYVLSRRGPAQVKFTNAEVREFGHLEVAQPIVLDSELKLDRASSACCSSGLTGRICDSFCVTSWRSLRQSFSMGLHQEA